MAVRFGASGHTVSLLAVTVVFVLEGCTGGEAAFDVTLELQGDCSDQLTFICRHDAVPIDPIWIHNGTAEGGQVLASAFPGLTMYSFQNSTEHRVTVTGVDGVTALDGYVFQCVYSIGGVLIKSNEIEYSFVPNDYQPALSLVSYRPDFSERLSTFTYSFQESCSLYPRCTSYFSVEHTVSPPSVISTTSSGCTVEYTISSLERCRTYHSTATVMFGSQRGNSIIVGITVMLSPGRFIITSTTIGADRDFINVTFVQNVSDCPGHPTERYTVDIDGVQVANMTADEFQSLTTSRTNGSVTLSIPLTQRLSEEAVTVNMTKFNTVPTDMSDDMGNTVTDMVTWGTSDVFGLQTTPAGPKFTSSDVGAIAGGTSSGVVLVMVLVIGGANTGVIIILIKKKEDRKQKNQIQQTNPCPPPEDNQLEEAESGTPQPLQQYAELEFAGRECRPAPAPPNENFNVQYTEICKV